MNALRIHRPIGPHPITRPRFSNQPAAPAPQPVNLIDGVDLVRQSAHQVLLDKIIALWHQVFCHGEPLDDYKKETEKAFTHPVVVAYRLDEKQEDVVSAAYMECPANMAWPYGHIYSVVANPKPEHLRKGHAEAVVRRLIENARAVGCKTVQLDVGRDNSAAMALYKKLGFEVVPKRSDVKMFRMRKVLAPVVQGPLLPPAKPAE